MGGKSFRKKRNQKKRGGVGGQGENKVAKKKVYYVRFWGRMGKRNRAGGAEAVERDETMGRKGCGRQAALGQPPVQRKACTQAHVLEEATAVVRTPA